MAKPPAPPAPATPPVGTPGVVARVLARASAKRTPAAATKPAGKLTAPKIPGDAPAKRGRGRPPKVAGPSDNPEAVRARQRRADARARNARQLTPAQLPPVSPPGDGAQLTPDALRSAELRPLTGPITTPAALTPASPAEIKSFSGLVKVVGILGAMFFGDHWKVTDDDALNTAELCLDAWPELRDMGDTKKVLAGGCLVGMLGERVRKTRDARRPRASSTELHESPAPAAPPASPPPSSASVGWSSART